MGHSPKVLTPGEEARVAESRFYPGELEELRKAKISNHRIMECESKYLLTELKEMAKTKGLSPAGDKELLCRRLIKAGVIR